MSHYSDQAEKNHESLGALAEKYGTDKGPSLHDYTRWYAHHLPAKGAHFTLLEIGVKRFASLRMWRAYFPKARIIGVDIEIPPGMFFNDCDIFITDQKKFHESLDLTGIRPDVIIDDGSHLWTDQITTFYNCWPYLEPGGVYVIEDLHTSYLQDYGDVAGITCIEFLQRRIDEMNLRGKSSGLGSLANDLKYNPQIDDGLSLFQRTVESMTFYKSIVFIHKRREAV